MSYVFLRCLGSRTDEARASDHWDDVRLDALSGRKRAPFLYVVQESISAYEQRAYAKLIATTHRFQSSSVIS